MTTGEEGAPRWIAGVDGCPGGWIAAFVDLARRAAPQARVVARFAEIVDAPERPAIVAVDMPIGLPEQTGEGGRGPEQAARRVLGSRKASVFAIPARAAVFAVLPHPEGMAALLEGHRRAVAAARQSSRSHSGFSFQAFNILPKIREVDELLRARPDLVARVHESHPEVAFWRMNGNAPLQEPKKIRSRVHAAGIAERRALLSRAGLPDALVMTAAPRGAALDDLIDALAMAVVAARILNGDALRFPDPPERDAFGLPICIRA